MKYRYLSIFLILLILSIGAVSAQENTATDGNVSSVKGVSTDPPIITDDNYNQYFNSTTGKILEDSGISDGSFIRIGNVTNKIFCLNVKNLEITSVSCSNLTNTSFYFVNGSDGAYVHYFNIDNNGWDRPAFNITDAENIHIQSINFNVVGPENSEDLYVIYADFANNLLIESNTITYTRKTNKTVFNAAIQIIHSDNVKVLGNNINASIPARSINWDIGAIYSEGVCLSVCENAVLDKNTIYVESNGKIGDYDTIYALHVYGNNATVNNNQIKVVEAPYNYGLVIDSKDFYIFNNTIYSGGNVDYACGMDVEPTLGSSGYIFSNNITTAGASSYGMYFSSWGGNVVATAVAGNIIVSNGTTVFGMSLSGSSSELRRNSILTDGNFTTGVASTVSLLTFDNNTIAARGSNVGTPAGYDMMGIKTIGLNIVSGRATVTNNNIDSNSKYAVEVGGKGSVTDNELYAEVLTGDFAVNYTQGEVTVSGNIPEMTLDYNVTNDTFYIYFDEEGKLREQITADNLTFIGEFSNVANQIIINKPVKLLSDHAVLNNIGISIQSDNVTVEGFTFIADEVAEVLTVCNSSRVSINNNVFTVNGLNDTDNTIILIMNSNNVRVDRNNITFGVLTNETFRNAAIYSGSSDVLIIYNNTIIASLPSRPINYTTEVVYSVGVYLEDCNDTVLYNNTIAVKSNGQIDEYDIINAVNIGGDDVTIENNTIGAIEAPQGYGIIIAGDTFQINNNTIYVGENKSVAYGIDVEGTSAGVIYGNMIVTVADDAYGISTDDWTGDVKVDIIHNMIISNGTHAYGMELRDSKAFVNDTCVLANGDFTIGINSIISNITISNCVVEATIGVFIYLGDEAIVTNNNIASNSTYAVKMYGNGNGKVTGNELRAEVLTGDFAVDYIQGEAIVANNTPAMLLNYTLTNDTFYIYFDEEGKLREQIPANTNLTFIGEFSDVAYQIIINKPVKLLSDDATLNDIGISIQSDNVTVDGFTFISDDLSEIVTVQDSDSVSVINNNFTVEGLNDTENAVIIVMDSDNVLIDNNTIIFGVETNDTFRNVAVCADGADDLIISNNTVVASLPSRSIDWTYGTVYSEGVCLNDCDNAVLFNNTIGVKSNDKQSTYDTIYAVHIVGDNATVEKNTMGAIEAPYGYGLVVTGDNFKIDNNMIYVGQNETYSCGIDVESNSAGVINENMIVTVGESSYGIYTANWAGDVKVNITDNMIISNGTTVFGMSLSGSKAFVNDTCVIANGNFTTGIASIISNITISNCVIEAKGSNIGTPAGYDMMGIETIGIHIVDGNATVWYNNVTSTSEFTVDVNPNVAGQVTYNYLIAKEYTGDASVNYTSGQAIQVDDNIPAMEKVFILADDVVMYYKNGTRYVVTLVDSVGTFLANKTVTITINGQNYTRITNENGTASMAINLNSGNYTVSTVYAGEAGYVNASTENSITVLSTVYGDDLVKVFRNASQYYATFVDGQGNPLAEGTNVTFNINGVMYERKTNANGTAKLNINLEQGTYIITAINPVNGEMHANNITVLSTITNNSDLVKYYRNASQYVVTLIGEDGKAVGAGENVTFNINGVFYTRTTNATGQAKLNINLNPGNYTITAQYKDCRVSNNIEVKPVLFAEDKVIKQGTSDQFRAKLLDGQGKPYEGQNITFNINGMFYSRTTDADGYAALTIRMTAAVNTYIITSSYNGTSISNKISIIP